MLVKNQMIEVFWSNRVINHYVSKGYKFTKRYEAFLVKAEDLNPTCTKKVKVICDKCGKEIISPYFAHYKRFTNREPDLCKSCAALLGYSRNKNTRAKDKFDLIETEVTDLIQNINETEVLMREIIGATGSINE